MGYFLTTEPETAVPANSRLSPKTHTPASPVKERGYRYFQPEMGRWCSRDQIDEEGGVNLYCFSINDPMDHFDDLGDVVGGEGSGEDAGRPGGGKRGKRIWEKIKAPSCKWRDCNQDSKTVCTVFNLYGIRLSRNGVCSACCGANAARCAAELAIWHGVALKLCTKLKNPWAIGTCLTAVTENYIFASFQLMLESEGCLLTCPQK